jgi:hypothetical protein
MKTQAETGLPYTELNGMSIILNYQGSISKYVISTPIENHTNIDAYNHQFKFDFF